MNNNKPNPKALNLEGLEEISKKVTVGFKCHPQIKLRLATQANKAGLTLSEFIETLIQELESAIVLEKEETKKLQQTIAFYENDILLDLFRKYEQQKVTYTTVAGNSSEITIESPQDVYTVLINSYKLKK